MMKIIFIRSNPVNPDSRVEKEVNSLVKAGNKVEIVAWDRNAKYSIRESYINIDAGRVKIYRFGIPSSFGGGMRKNLGPLILFQIRLFCWLYKNRNEYDVIHACDFDTALISFHVARKLRKKIIYDIFDYYVDAFRVPNYLKRYIEKMDHKIINSADTVIICSEKRKEQIKGTNPKRLEIIHNTPENTIKSIGKINLDKTKIKLVYVGVLGNGRFLKETADIVKDNPKLEFHIGGFGEYEKYFKEMSLNHKNILYYGKLPYKKTIELENSCDIMTAIYDPSVPNHYYAAPNKFYEALMLGKPLIMVRDTGMSDIVKQENIGELIEYERDSLQEALIRIAEKKDEWPTIAANMKSLYEEKYSWSQMEERLLRIYRSI